MYNGTLVMFVVQQPVDHFSACNVRSFAILPIDITSPYYLLFPGLASCLLFRRCHYSVMALLSSHRGLLKQRSRGWHRENARSSACHRLVTTSRSQYKIDYVTSFAIFVQFANSFPLWNHLYLRRVLLLLRTIVGTGRTISVTNELSEISTVDETAT